MDHLNNGLNMAVYGINKHMLYVHDITDFETKAQQAYCKNYQNTGRNKDRSQLDPKSSLPANFEFILFCFRDAQADTQKQTAKH